MRYSGDFITDFKAPLPEPEPAAQETPAIPEGDGMPGFEALDVPVAAPAQPQSTVSDAIQAHAGSEYVQAGGPAAFDEPVNNIIEGSDGNPDQYVDPFQVPLAPVPDLSEEKEIAPISSDHTSQVPPVGVASDEAIAPTLEQIEQTTMPPLPPTDLPPLPPLPDFSMDTNLPPLPPPPPPPVFDQPAATSNPIPSGAVSSDKLGDIFGDAPAQPDTPPAPQEPPKPGQFQIPGQ